MTLKETVWQAVTWHDGIVVGGNGGVLTEARAAASTAEPPATAGTTPAATAGTTPAATAGTTPAATAGPSSSATNPVGPIVNQFYPLHFDHTSTLKTIARRFMSAKPPYLSARYAAAEDLSSVLGNEMQTSRFLPFIPYNFVYSQSQKRLDVQWATTSPGAPLWQYDPNTTVAQQFSFEDAGGGFFYIRTHTGNLYLTAGANGVTQQLKYTTGSGAIAGQNPDAQRWSLTTTSVVVTQQNLLTIHNAAFPGTVLQPAGNSANSEALVVLAAPQQTHGIEATPNAWQVTSPLLPSSGEVLTNA